MIQTVVLPYNGLGLLAPRIEGILATFERRSRGREFVNYVKLLKLLNIIPKEGEVSSISIGVHRDGSKSLIIIGKDVISQTVIGQTGPDKAGADALLPALLDVHVLGAQAAVDRFKIDMNKPL